MLRHIDVPQGSPEWFAARLGRVTASEAASVLAQGRGKSEAVTRRDYRTRLVCERLTGTMVEEPYTNSAMEHGTMYEPMARERFAATIGETVQESGFWLRDDLMVGASLDGYISRGNPLSEIVEIKCPFKTAIHLQTLRDGTVPSNYVPQVTHQLWLTGAEGVHFVSFDPSLPEALQLAWIYTPRSAFDVDGYAAAVEQFLKDVDDDVAEWTARIQAGV